MSDYYWLTKPQLERIKPYFPRSHGRPRVDDQRVISGIIHVIRNGLRWRDGAVTLRCIGRRRSTTTQFQAAAVTSCHLSIAAARNCRSVRRDMRWR